MTDSVGRVESLRDEVLDTSGGGEPPGAPIFNAVLRRIGNSRSADANDFVLQEVMSRRLAWGEAEHAILADIDAICSRLARAAHRSLRSPQDRQTTVLAALEVGCAAVRMVATATVGRAGRERAAQMREELAMSRLRDALHRQGEELARLRAAMAPR